MKKRLFFLTLFAVITAFAFGNSPGKLTAADNAIPNTTFDTPDYCTPSYGTGCGFDDAINFVELAGESETISNATGCSSSGYGDYTDLTPADLAPGETYTITLATDYSSPSSENVRVWIDFNLDGEFSQDEIIASTSDGMANGNNDFDFEVPETVSPGLYRMRVRLTWDDSNFDACQNLEYGEAEDYMVEILELNDCEGPVTAGSPTQTEMGVCANINFSISVTGASDPANGLLRNWQSSPAGQDDWTDIEGAHSNTYTAVGGINEPTDYRYMVVCESGDDEPDYSDIIEVSLNPGVECYCTPVYNFGCNIEASITNVTIIGESETLNNDSECSYDGYSDFTDLTPANLAPGNNYVISVTTDYPNPAFVDLMVWIDFNLNGSFDDEGENIFDSNAQGMSSATENIDFQVPANAEPGVYRLRLRTIYNNGNTFTACSLENYGEAEDYLIEVIELEDCEGEVTAGEVNEENFSVCAYKPFSVSVSGASDPAEGLNRIWQYSPAGEDDWTDITTNGNANTYNSPGVGEDTDFRYRVQCNDGEPVYSNVIQVTMKPGNECYCIPTGAGNNSDEIINFTLANIENDTSAGEALDGPGYSDYSTIIAPAILIPGDSYVASLTSNDGSGNHGAAIWIDYNDDGFFDEDEMVAFISNSIQGGVTAEFPPFTVADAPGTHRLRVQYTYSRNGDELDPCSSYTVYSETEDYSVNVITLEDCEGTPTAGTAAESFGVCAGVNFTISVMDASEFAEGLTRQWQSSPAGQEDWTNMEGANFDAFQIQGGIFEPTDYRYVLQCGDGDPVYSDVIEVTLNPGVDCYCIPTYTYGCDSNDTINGVNLIGESETLNNQTGCSNNSYGDYTDLTPADLAPGESYTLTVQTNGYAVYEQAKAWIDYNLDGFFSEDEKIADTNNAGLDANGSKDFTFEIPQDAAAGLYRMRVRLVYGSDLTFEACGNESHGETEDYMIEIIELDSCNATPSAGTINEDELSACALSNFSISTSGASDPAEGLNRQWQSSPAGEDTWTDVEGAHSSTLIMTEGVSVPTDFRYVVTCNYLDENNSDISNIATVSLNPVTDCYCIPSLNPDGYDSYYITNFNTEGALQNVDNSSDSGENGYSDFTDQHIIVYPGQSIDYSVTSSSTYQFYYGWIDLNQDGNFDGPGENIFSTSTTDDVNNYTGSWEVPEDLEEGNYRLRIRTTISPDSDSCTSDYFGEAEDYTLTVIFPDCFPPINIEVNFVTDDSAQVVWDANEESSWEVIYGESGFDPETEGENILVNDNPVADLIDLNDNTAYQVYVKTLCGDNESVLIGPASFTSNITPPENTRLCDAIHLNPNMGCAGGPYTNVAAFEEAGELGGSCLNVFRGHNSVWFTFESPQSGNGILSTNFSQTEFTTEMVVFEGPADCEDITTLGAEVACSNNGNDLEFSGLNPGETYYVKVTGFNEEEGEFCIGYEPDGDLVNVDVQIFENFTYYPNPVENELTLKAGNIIEKIVVYNLLGQQILEVKPGSTQAQISTENLASGTYMMKVSIDGAEKTFRVIKK